METLLLRGEKCVNNGYTVLIIADIEGIHDVYDLNNINQCHESYNDEIAAYVNALVKNGIVNIDICDAHDQGDLLAQVPQRCRNANIKVISTISDIRFETEYVFAIMVGFHGMAGSCGILPHSFRYNFKEVSICGVTMQHYMPIGEVEVYSRWLGSKGIPVILISGDREAIYEGNCFNPYRETCCVKSYFETSKIDRDLVIKKIQNSVDCAMKLDYKKCTSSDDSSVYISFTHNDLLDEFKRLGYKCVNRHVMFNNCSEFVSSLYNMVDVLTEFDKATFAANYSLLQELRTLASSTSRENLINSEIGNILAHCNLYSLDRDARSEIRAYFENKVNDVWKKE